MRTKNLISTIILLHCCTVLLAQHVKFDVDDSRQRGYYDRPYIRYEAEPGKCLSNSSAFLPPTHDQQALQSEASNQQALQLLRAGDFVEWTVDFEANALTLRFSLPDAADGNGLQGELDICVNGKAVKRLDLSSYWAWQYAFYGSQDKMLDNIPSEDKFARMRFDETHVLLPTTLHVNDRVSLLKVSEDGIPYTIDFVELELAENPLQFKDIKDKNKVAYSPEQGDIADFIASHGGMTIYIPVGKFYTDKRIEITAPHTRLLGAGMWYSEIYFTASSDNLDTYSHRGIFCQQDSCEVNGLYLNTVNSQRYYHKNSRYQVGKSLMGSFGTGSKISHVWSEHFECGGWIDRCINLQVSYCRFRNNYADGINLDFGSRNSSVSHCSFRNNGDDDMASWSRGQEFCEQILYEYNTAENNWRASSVGFFGGKGHIARKIVVIDAMEAGVRTTCDFPGREFSDEGTILYEDISIWRSGCSNGSLGFSGDLINGMSAGAIHITAFKTYDLVNVTFRGIDIYDAKDDAVFINCNNGKKVINLLLDRIHVYGAGGHGISLNESAGNATFSNLQFERTAKSPIAENLTNGYFVIQEINQ